MKQERRAYQQELAFRTSDSLPFVDKGIVREVVRTILESNHRRFIYPFVLDGKEIGAIRRHLLRHHGDLESRVLFVPGIRLEDGQGTLIEIAKEERARRERR